MSIISKGDGYVIRNPTSAKEVQALYWPFMQSLGWNRAEADGHTHYVTAGPESWLLLCPDDSDKPEGFICAFSSANKVGWVGLYCINESHRGRGLGRPLFKACMDLLHARGSEFIGLDAVPAQVGTYVRRRFVYLASVKIMDRPPFTEQPLQERTHSLSKDEKLADIREMPKKALVRSDLEHTGMERSTLWTDEALFDRDDVIGFAITDRDGSGKLLGWIISRASITGHRIGPLYAESARIASILLYAVLENLQHAQGDFTVELPPRNKYAPPVFMELGFLPGGDMYRMWFDGGMPAEQRPTGKAETCVYAWFDAAQG